LKAPFPYFGGKAAVAHHVWAALGQPKHYIEPFFGSGAVLLVRPHWQPGMIETVNDLDCQLANVWRSLQFNPDEVARWCDWPVNHCDLSARKRQMLENENYLREGLNADPDWHDPKLAGYWIWAASCWIGSGLTCLGQRPHVGTGGMGVHALGQRPHVSDGGKGVHALGRIPHVSDGGAVGVQEPYNTNLYAWFRSLAERLRYVRVVCGDWTRVCGGNWQDNSGVVGIFFDPPYGVQDRYTAIYHHDSTSVAAEVAKWCLERGERPTYRIVVAGYIEEHPQLKEAGWRVQQWKAQGGYGKISKKGKQDNQGKKNRFREALFFSPHCLKQGLF